MQTININEIFASINGEVNRWGQGSLTVFIRFQGCNLECSYCDTKYAQKQKHENLYSISNLLKKIETFGIKRVTITGGEPLLQGNVFELIDELLLNGYQISIETNGSMLINFDQFYWRCICWVVDYKMNFSSQMIEKNYLNLSETDYIKFVINNKSDFDEALSIKEQLQKKECRANFAFSPTGANLELANSITQWLIDQKIDDVILNLQIHKIINIK